MTPSAAAVPDLPQKELAETVSQAMIIPNIGVNSMKTLLQNLIRLQQLELEEIQIADATKVIADLRNQIPTQILGHYDRLMARGKKGIVPVRGQACSGCHMRLPIGTISELMKAEDIQLCDSCGRYLYLEEVVGITATASASPSAPQTAPRAPSMPPKKKAARKKAAPTAASPRPQTCKTRSTRKT